VVGATLLQTLPVSARNLVRKIIKIVANICQILSSNAPKSNLGWRSAPDPARAAYSAPTDPLAGFNRPTSKGGWGK